MGIYSYLHSYPELTFSLTYFSPYQNPYDRMMRRGLKKVEMVDAWTQTSNRGSDTEDVKK